MNSDQIASIVRTVLKIGSGLLIAHGMSDTASIINLPDVAGLLTLLVSLAWSHFAHTGPDQPSPPNLPKLSALVALGAAALLFTGPGCTTTPQRASYQTAATITVSVETALKVYDQFAAAGQTTPAQNAAVKAAYLKYQAAAAVVCDAGAVYAATSGTNAPPASAALQTAIVNANVTMADLFNLIRSFGVKL